MKLLILILSSLSLISCARELGSYVDGARSPSYVDQPTIISPDNPQLEGQLGIKVSPGSVISQGSHVSMKAGITASLTSATSASLGARIGLSRGPAHQ